MAYLGIDLGTSGLRALLVDGDGVPLGSAEQAYDTQTPHPGWSEQDPQLWITALTAAVAELRATCPGFVDLRGIGVAGHMHGAVLLDQSDQVLRPCILWNDTRSHAEAAHLDALPGVRETSGNIVFPGFTAPKIAWIRQHEPEVFDQVAKVLLPAAFLNLYLTGDHVADMSDSAGTSWLDVDARDWSDALLSAGHMRRDQMPRLVEGSEKAGQLRDSLRQDWGLRGPVWVAGGAGDNAAAACGIGALGQGQGFASLGTSGVLLLARDGFDPAPETAIHTFCHAVPGRWYQMGVMLSATASLNWLGRITGQTPRALTDALGPDLRAPQGPLFLPYLAGERTPHNDAAIRGAFTGLSTGTTLADLTQSVLEGVSFGLRDCAEAMPVGAAKPASLFVIGGGSASDYWCRLLATVLDTPLHRPRGGEFGAALGAARLALAAVTGGPEAEIFAPPADVDVFAPDLPSVPAMDAAYARYRESYPRLKQG